MGKRQRRRLREQDQQPPQGTTPAATVNAGLATAESSVTGPGNDEEQGP